MADGFKILAQATLTGSEVAIYTVPTPSGGRFATRGNSQAVISSIILCCTGGGSSTYSIRVKENSTVSDSPSELIFNNQAIALADTDVLSLGIGLVSGNLIKASLAGGSAEIQMNIFGTEVL